MRVTPRATPRETTREAIFGNSNIANGIKAAPSRSASISSPQVLAHTHTQTLTLTQAQIQSHSQEQTQMQPLQPQPQHQNNPKLTVQTKIGGTIFEVNGFFRTSGKTISEKLFDLMSKELDNQEVFCYNGGTPQEQKL